MSIARSEAQRRRWRNLDARARQSATMSAVIRQRWTDPNWVRKRVKTCFHCGRTGYRFLQVEGADGAFECRDVAECEDRIVERADAT